MFGNKPDHGLGGSLLVSGFEAAGPLQRALEVLLAPSAGDGFKNMVSFINGLKRVRGEVRCPSWVILSP